MENIYIFLICKDDIFVCNVLSNVVQCQTLSIIHVTLWPFIIMLLYGVWNMKLAIWSSLPETERGSVCVCVNDGWLKQPHLARGRLIGLWGWSRLHTWLLNGQQHPTLNRIEFDKKLMERWMPTSYFWNKHLSMVVLGEQRRKMAAHSITHTLS